MFLESQVSQVAVVSSSPLPPYTLLHGDYFYLIWTTKIINAKWDFQVREHFVEVDVHLPVPTTKQLQTFCGSEGVLMQFAPPTLHWEIVVPENIVLIPNKKLCTTFSDDFLLGLRVPVKTVDEDVSLSVA